MNIPSSGNIEDLGTLNKPFFGATFQGGEIKTYGLTKNLSGHRIKRPEKRLDDGLFVEWVWDGTKLIVENDRYGLYPLFYCSKDSQIWVSTSLEEILRGNASDKLDFAAIAVFLGLGMFLGQDTPFGDIRILAPNSRLTWKDGVTSIECRVEPTNAAGTMPPTRKQAIETYAELFRQAIARRPAAENAVAVPLSGGRDSRHILFELVAQGRKPHFCATVRYRPPATNIDAQIAGLVAQELGVDHFLIERPTSFFDAVRMDVHLTNFCGGGHAWILPVADFLRPRATTIFDGIAGDVLSNGFLLEADELRLFELGHLEELALRILRKTNRYEAGLKLVTKQIGGRMFFEQVVSRLVDELENHASRPNPISSFYFWNRTRRAIGSIPSSIYSGIPVVYCPYLDHELFDFLNSLSPSFFLEGAFHDDTIRYAYPQWAHIPYEDGRKTDGRLDVDARSYYRSSLGQFFRYLAGNSFSRNKGLVKRSYLLARSAAALLSGRAEIPWYMGLALYFEEVSGVSRSMKKKKKSAVLE